MLRASGMTTGCPFPDSMTKEQSEKNLLDLSPAHAVKWDTREDDKIVLYKPKYKNRFLVKHLVPRLNNPDFRINLDRFGSWVWKAIDDQKTVFDIGEQLHEEFGNEIEPVFDRLGLFINRLARSRLITLRDPASQ